MAFIPAWYDSRTFNIANNAWLAICSYRRRQGHQRASEYQPGCMDDRYHLLIRRACGQPMDLNDLSQAERDMFFGELVTTSEVEMDKVTKFKLSHTEWDSLPRGGELDPISSSEDDVGNDR